MNYIARPTDFKSWATVAYDKIILVIDSCTTVSQLQAANRMVDNFISVIVYDEDVSKSVTDIKNTINLFYTLINLKRTSLS